MRIINLFILLFICTNAIGSEIIDSYKLTIKLTVPVVVNNMQSEGKRVFKKQNLVGTLNIIYLDNERPKIQILGLTNKSYRIRSKYVTYETLVDDEYWIPKYNYIGNNKTGSFTKSTIVFYIDANPSYNIGKDEPDNTLILVLSGRGYSKWYNKCNSRITYKFNGYVSGQLGCGCHAYGHISPTRVAGWRGPTSEVEDISSAFGKFTLKFISRTKK